MADNVYRRRNELELTQQQLADRARLDRATVGRVEKAKDQCTLATVQIMATALRCQPWQLLKP